MSTEHEVRQSIGRLAKQLSPEALGLGLTCTEAEAIADVLRTAGHHERADAFIERHSHDDDDIDDLHHARYHVLHETPRTGCCIDESIEPAEKVVVTTWRGDDTVTQAFASTAWLVGRESSSLDIARAAGRMPKLPPIDFGSECDGCDRITPGIRFNVENGGVDGIERCDSCQRYDSDLVAAAVLAYTIMSHHPNLGIIEVRYERKIA